MMRPGGCMRRAGQGMEADLAPEKDSRPWWKRARHRLEWAGAAFLARVVPLLPRRAALWLARLLGDAWYFLDGKLRAVALANLRLVFGPDTPEAELRRIARGSFRTLARTVLDMLWARRLNERNFSEWFVFEGLDERTPLVRERGAVLVLSHFGAFEWIGIGIGYKGWTGAALTREFKNPLLAPLYNAARASSGQRVVTRRGALLYLLRQLRRRGLAGVLVDLTLPVSQPSRIVPVFGHVTNVPAIHAILHKRTGAPLVPVEAFPEKDGRCRIVVHPPLAVNPEMEEGEIVRAVWAFLEERIRSRPELWMWAYKHWRFADPRRPEAAPFYANRSSVFDKKLRAETGGW